MAVLREKRTDIKIGDVVLIHDDNPPRSNWGLGEVKELIDSRDWYKRVVLLLVASKKEKHLTMRRPMQEYSSVS